MQVFSARLEAADPLRVRVFLKAPSKARKPAAGGNETCTANRPDNCHWTIFLVFLIPIVNRCSTSSCCLWPALGRARQENTRSIVHVSRCQPPSHKPPDGIVDNEESVSWSFARGWIDNPDLLDGTVVSESVSLNGTRARLSAGLAIPQGRVLSHALVFAAGNRR